ncbi:MAG: LysE family transporter [Anaerolineales bacterium]|nr:LysE family transporter [Anaerolineales bacterium]
MIRYLLIGSSFALAAALQPGPLQVFYLSKVADQGWRKTMPAAFAPLISDGPIALVAVLVVGQLPPNLWVGLQAAGGLLLLFLAASSLRSWQKHQENPPGQGEETPRTVLQAALVNLLNPNPYLAWSLVLGPAVLEAWTTRPIFALGLLMAFYGVMIAASLILIRIMGTASALGPDTRRTLLLVSALLLAGLGLYFLGNAGWELALRLS